MVLQIEGGVNFILAESESGFTGLKDLELFPLLKT